MVYVRYIQDNHGLSITYMGNKELINQDTIYTLISLATKDTVLGLKINVLFDTIELCPMCPLFGGSTVMGYMIVLKALLQGGALYL